MAEFVRACKKSEVPEGGMKLVEAEGEDVCLINSGGQIYAIEELCPHQDGPLHEGRLEDGEVVCPWHDARFDFKTGRRNPDTDWADRDVKTFEVKVEGDEVYVKV